ncbi:hypothetical protein, variant 2 [Aphanomyces invadans]|uniref:START domain-containing protein n=1 Tax=Aphanomyces invadans TaxID=157072 RepID=A0A024TQM9_9STRA|nr:hypothetical protein, variant 2 [Aphanomyces invadans]ETV96430.1 hypothetical protein, variant 2 [Aphanomyces invadans]|eukprot:XP_008874693.1 hypothetical protein, variant 2 [Aphanomyces invadans]
MKLPLPADFFQCPALSPHDTKCLTNQATASAMAVVNKTQLQGGPIAWSLRSNEGDLQIFKGIHENSNEANAFVYMSITEVTGTIEEVVELFQTRTTAQAKQFTTRFGKQLVDAIKLYSLVPASADNPMEMADITWRAYKSPMSFFVAKRDACLLEVNHAFQLNARRGWVVSTESVALPCCPDLQDLVGLVRMHNFGSGHVFLESDCRPGCLEIRYVAHVDFRGASFDYVSDAMLKRRAWLSDLNMTKRCRNLKCIDQFLREDRLSRESAVPARHVPHNLRVQCHLCDTHFGWTNTKTNCFKCGEVVCKSCNPYWSVTRPERRRDFTP